MLTPMVYLSQDKGKEMIKMKNENYNGWSNRITWLVALHFDEYFQGIVATMLEENDDLENPLGIDEVANSFEEAFSQFMDEELENVNVFVQDALPLSDIDYYNIAENFID